jgi:hypothetical protein
MKKHMISLLSIGPKHIKPFFTEHDKTCLNCSTNQKRDDLLEVFGAVCTCWRCLVPYELRDLGEGKTRKVLYSSLLLSQSIFHLSALRLPCVLCCAALVLLVCVALTSYKIRRIAQVARVPSHSN